MRVKLDENLPEDLVDVLSRYVDSVDTVREEQLGGQSDPAIFDAARREQRLLITQDLDFSDVRRFAPGSHPGIVLIRLRNPTRRSLIARLASVLDIHDIRSWAGCFVVVSDDRLRVRRP